MSPMDATGTSDRSPAIPAGMRIYAIGDVHGRLDLLEHILAQISDDLSQRPVNRPVLLMLGDYIDRGPQSAGVLELLASGLGDAPERVLIKGNHEDMLLKFLDDASVGSSWRQLGGLETMLSYRIPIKDILSAGGAGKAQEALRRCLPQHHLALLESLQPSWWAGDYFFCHAGVRPGVPLGAQRPEDLMWIRGAFLESNEPFGKIIVHGHTPVAKPEELPNRINIDTGACVTNRLTCLVLEASERRWLST